MKKLDQIAAMEPEMRVLLAQLGRYAATGLAVTALQALIYWLLATPVKLHPQLANGIAYLFAVALGYVLHSAFTFRGHGARDKTAIRGIRFILVSLVSLGLNAMWVQIFVVWLDWATWVPVPFMLFVTPFVVFGLNRQWVFR
ncbi:GtrA family protein [Rhizorhapis suberifaciens]|uniref:Putative flippase GtrA n=1 Tax=Rhizorhapis suberifaciens TaxID=13656 RepID=A0A840HTR0_9SPHN|nr:GtrA family protein [Rhizorhapis suberifaciens]MBB4641592.1 putative flippase GtrA [Rhizorhapis suberifaciens]